MKNLIILMLLPFLFIACDKDEDEEENGTIMLNQFKGTSWTAPDDIASFIYGGDCTTTIEFLTDQACQQIDYHPTGFSAGTTTEQGTYYYKGDSVTFTINERTIRGKKTGSVIVTTMGTMSGGKRTYTLNK